MLPIDRPMAIGTIFKDEASMYATDANIPEYFWCEPAQQFESVFSLRTTLLQMADQRRTIDEWVVETFGPADVRWFQNGNRYCFYSEADRTLFAMKWV